MRTASKPHPCHSVHRITLTSVLSQQLTSLVPSSVAFVVFWSYKLSFLFQEQSAEESIQTNLQTEASKLFVAVDNCSEQVVNQNTNVVVEVCKIARKRTSGVNSIKHLQV